MNFFKKILFWLLDIIESVSIASALFVITYIFFFQPTIVQGASSYPTLETGERIIIEKLTPRFNGYQRGDFVIPESPASPDIIYIKRVIGLPGEQIKIDSCHVYINGELLSEPYLSTGVCTNAGQGLKNNKVVIPEDYYFLMGDNREHSSDSRSFGSVHKDHIVGRAWLRFWPPDRFGWLNSE